MAFISKAYTEEASARVLGEVAWEEAYGGDAPTPIREFRYLAEIRPDGVARLLTVSADFHDAIGLTAEQVNDAGGWFARVMPADRERLDGHLSRLRAGRPAVGEYRILAGNDSVRWVQDEAEPRQTLSNGTIHVRGRVRDVTEWKRAASGGRSVTLLTGVIDSLPDPVLVKDRHGMYLLVNDAAAQAMGRTAQDIVLRSDREVFLGRDWSRVRAQDDLVIESGDAHTFEEQATTPKGERTYLASKVPYRDDRGSIIGVVAIARDVTEERRSQAERQRLLERLVNAEEDERRRIAHALHDDSVQVLTALAMQLDLLGGNLASDDDVRVTNEAATTARLAIARLRGLMFNLYPPTLTRLGLAPALGHLLRGIRDDTGLDIALTVDLDGDAPRAVNIAVFRITQEAVRNAVKHSGASRVEVHIDQAGGSIRGRVHDDGRGFDPADPTGTPAGHYGLLAMRERAESSGGTLNLESVPGSGTTVSFVIPMQSDPDQSGRS